MESYLAAIKFMEKMEKYTEQVITRCAGGNRERWRNVRDILAGSTSTRSAAISLDMILLDMI